MAEIESLRVQAQIAESICTYFNQERALLEDYCGRVAGFLTLSPGSRRHQELPDLTCLTHPQRHYTTLVPVTHSPYSQRKNWGQGQAGLPGA